MPQRIVCPIHGKFQMQCGCTKQQMTVAFPARSSGQMLAATPSCAALREYISEELRKARRCRRMAAKDMERFQTAFDYWEGQIAALVKLRTKVLGVKQIDALCERINFGDI